jgi:exopolysaccharide biosynthesis polyprenyl glycosylphosphotransferase
MTVLQADLSALGSATSPSKVRARRRWLTIVLAVADFLTANAAFFLAYHLRYTFNLGGDVPGESYVPYSSFVPLQAVFVVLVMLGYQIRGSYKSARFHITSEALAVVSTTAITAMLVFAIASMQQQAFSRLAFIYVWALAVVMGVATRVMFRLIQAHAYRAGVGAERVIVVGNNRLARMVMQLIAQQPELGAKVLGFVDDDPDHDFGRFRALGTLDHLPALTRELQADRVIVALPAARHTEILRVLDQCQEDGVGLSLVPDLFEMRLSHVSMDTLGGIPLLELEETRIGGGNLLVKRVLDACLSAVGLVGLMPFLLLVSLAIKLDSSGPVLFVQTRLGKDGTPFNCFKFRSMRTGAELERSELEAFNEAQGPIFKMRDDPRLTRVGRLLRRMSLDELPQLINVLRGEMSLVGPRPPIPSEVELYEDWHRRRLEVVPGITGLWQVSGRSELTFDEMVMLDLYYIENWSLALDIQIMARTIPTVLAAHGAF